MLHDLVKKPFNKKIRSGKHRGNRVSSLCLAGPRLERVAVTLTIYRLHGIIWLKLEAGGAAKWDGKDGITTSARGFSAGTVL